MVLVYPRVLLVTATVLLVAFAGCSGDKDTPDAGKDPSTYTDADKFDHATANEGFQVTGSLAGTGAAIDATSAVTLKVVDNVASDAAGAGDKATLILDAKTTGLHVQATMRSMTTAADAGDPAGDFLGGVGQNVQLPPEQGLPATKAFLIAYGLARVSINGELLDDLQVVGAAVTFGLHDTAGAVLTEADTHDLELQVVFPGSTAGFDAVPDTPDGFLYFYFENVAMMTLSVDDKAAVGADLSAPPRTNQPPVLSARVLVDGQQALQGQKEGSKPLNVTFDASATTDPDGQIDAVSWEVFDLNRTGEYTPATTKRVTGVQAAYSFDKAGPKIINVRAIDSDGAIANTSLAFFVNHHLVTSKADDDVQAQSGGAGTECVEALNCNVHFPVLEAGIETAKFHFVDKSTEINEVHLDLYKPSQARCGTAGANPTPTDSAVDKDLVTPKSKLTEVGQYKLCVWYKAGAMVKWDIDILLTYAPPVAT